MTMFDIFIYVYFGLIFVAFFAEGLWGDYFHKHDLVSPVAVAFLWPIGLAIGAIAAPFAVAYLLGFLFQRKRGESNKNEEV